MVYDGSIGNGLIAEELNLVFHRATLRKEAQTIVHGRHWRMAGEIMEKTNRAIEQADEAFRREYGTRVEVARRQIINEAGAKTKDLVDQRYGQDLFSASDILRQAQREVRHEHEQLIARLQHEESTALEALMVDALRCNNIRGKPRQAFKRATDRRSGQDRREGPGRLKPMERER